MNRRRFLASIGAASASTLLAGCPSMSDDHPSNTNTARNIEGMPGNTTHSARAGDRQGNGSQSGPSTRPTQPPKSDTVRYGIEFDRVIDVVDDLGADPTGTEPVDDIIDEHYEDGVLLEFPPGSFLVERTHSFDENVNGWGMVGTGSSLRDVEFVFPKGNNTATDPDNHYVLNVQSGRNHVVANMVMQQTRDRVTGVGFIIVISDGLHVENLEFAGYNPVSGRNPGTCLIPDVTDIRGTGVVKNFICTGGGVEDTYPARKVGILCGPFHVGELKLLGHDIRNMGSHPHYTSNHRGCIRTENCYFENNDNTNIRISGGLNGGHPKKESWVRNCTILVDTDDADHLPEGERYEFVRGIKCDYGQDVLIADTDVVFKSAPASPYCIGVQHNHGKATLKNVRIHSAINGIGPLFEAQGNKGPVVLENVNFTGTASEFYDTEAGISVRGRNNSVIRNCCINLRGGDQNGISIRNAEGCRIEDVAIAVPGEDIVTNNARPVVSGVHDDAECPAASVDS